MRNLIINTSIKTHYKIGSYFIGNNLHKFLSITTNKIKFNVNMYKISKKRDIEFEFEKKDIDYCYFDNDPIAYKNALKKEEITLVANQNYKLKNLISN